MIIVSTSSKVIFISDQYITFPASICISVGELDVINCPHLILILFLDTEKIIAETVLISVSTICSKEESNSLNHTFGNRQ